MLSDAIGLERLSRIVGYKLTGGDFSPTSPNLPQRIAIIGQANTANQAGLDLAPKQITSAKLAGDTYGYGSPIHQVSRILKPVFGDGVGGIPVYAYPQVEPTGGAAKVTTLTVTGTATSNGTHTVVINGRSSIDGVSYSFSVSTGDTAAQIATKVQDVVASVLAAPCGAVATGPEVAFTSKWKGQDSDVLVVSIDNGGDGLGLTYAFASTTPGSGVTNTVGNSLALFGEDWNTIVVNCYTLDETAVLEALETFNGRPDATNPTGRYSGEIMKPFVSLVGTNSASTSIGVNYTDTRKNEVTNAICVAQAANAFPCEIAANYALLFAKVSQNTPHLDIGGSYLPDVPLGSQTGYNDMQSYDFRDQVAKQGCSTAYVVNGQYQVQDFLTTYRPDGESVPQYRYARNLMLDYNVRFGYYLLEQINVIDHAIVNDDDVVNAQKVIKPKQWIGIVNQYAEDLSNRALIADPSFMQDSIQVAISSTNPDRLETFFRYKRSGIVRISSTTAEAGFNFGSN